MLKMYKTLDLKPNTRSYIALIKISSLFSVKDTDGMFPMITSENAAKHNK